MVGESQESQTSQHVLNERRSLLDRVRSVWRRNPQTPTFPTPELTSSATPPVSSDEKEPTIPPRQTGICEAFIAKLKELGITAETETFEKVGVAALEGTNETGDPLLFEKVRNQEQAPNGYLIGIGAANVFSMLEAFPEGFIPKAILLFDVDPQVVAAGKKIIEDLKNEPETPPEKIEKQVINPGWATDSRAALVKYRPLLRQLAKEGNLAIAQVDFTDPRLIDELAKLPDIRTFNNVTYLSNIADHLWRRQNKKGDTDSVPDFGFLSNLQPQPPHRNYYIDTLEKSLDYKLRISPHYPVFSEHDFLSVDARIQTRPTDEIDPPSENPVWEDISQWDLNRLINNFHKLSNSPNQRQRKAYIQHQISEGRSELLSKYDEYKQRTNKPPKEALPALYWQYVVPTDPAEEKSLLAELSQPYDYDRDFIPFIAHTLWRSADFPWQINYHSLPRRINRIINHETGVRTYVVDTREAVKGNIEVALLEAGVPFEELAMAKLYQEVEKRLLNTKKPDFARGKSFEELVKEITP